jgi:hypothetical protein
VVEAQVLFLDRFLAAFLPPAGPFAFLFIVRVQLTRLLEIQPVRVRTHEAEEWKELSEVG